MKDYMSYLTIENLVLVVVVLALLFGIGCLINCVVSIQKEKKRKKHPFVFQEKHVGKLFKLMKLDKENDEIVYLHPDPNRNYPSGDAKKGEWFNSVDIPKELMREAQVLEVLEVSKKEAKIVGHSLF